MAGDGGNGLRAETGIVATMAWRDWLPFDWGGSEKKSYNIQDLVRDVSFMPGADLQPGAITREAYKSNPTVAASVQRITTAASQVPWVAQAVGADGEGKDLPKTHEVNVLMAKPNPWHSWYWLVEAMVGSLVLQGEAYAFLNGPDLGKDARSPGRPPLEILWIPKEQVFPIKKGLTDETVEFRVSTPGGSIVMIPVHRMVCPMLWSPENAWKGQSRVQAAGGSVDVANEGRRWNRSLLRNSARPPGVLQGEGPMDDAARKRNEEAIRRWISGSRNAGTPLVLEGGLKWEPNGLTAVDMDWLQGLREMKRDISTALGVDPSILGDPEVRTYANYQEARASLYQDTTLPLMCSVREAMELKLRQWWPELRFFFDTDKVPALLASKREAWTGLKDLVDSGLLTRNEARREMGFDDAKGGDVILVNVGLMPLESAAEPPIAPVSDEFVDGQGEPNAEEDEKPKDDEDPDEKPAG